MRFGIVRAAVMLSAATLAACSLAPTRPDNAAAIRAIQAGSSGTEVVVTGPVLRVLSAAQGPSGLHERFVITVHDDGNTIPVLVADNISIAQAAPLQPGDDVTVKGELAVDPVGPVIHWTHRDPRFRHQPGFIQVGGKLYE